MVEATLNLRVLEKADPEVAELILREYRRQSDTLELIPSENLASAPILEALGTSTSSPTPGARRTPPPTRRSARRATASWAWTYPPVATSPMAAPRTSA